MDLEKHRQLSIAYYQSMIETFSVMCDMVNNIQHLDSGLKPELPINPDHLGRYQERIGEITKQQIVQAILGRRSYFRNFEYAIINRTEGWEKEVTNHAKIFPRHKFEENAAAAGQVSALLVVRTANLICGFCARFIPSEKYRVILSPIKRLDVSQRLQNGRSDG